MSKISWISRGFKPPVTVSDATKPFTALHYIQTWEISTRSRVWNILVICGLFGQKLFHFEGFGRNHISLCHYKINHNLRSFKKTLGKHSRPPFAKPWPRALSQPFPSPGQPWPGWRCPILPPRRHPTHAKLVTRPPGCGRPSLVWLGSLVWCFLWFSFKLIDVSSPVPSQTPGPVPRASLEGWFGSLGGSCLGWFGYVWVGQTHAKHQGGVWFGLVCLYFVGFGLVG